MKIVINNPKSTTWFIVALEEEFKTNTYNVIYTGVGKVNAAMATQYLLDNYNVDILINIGTAGSSSKLKKDTVYEINLFKQRDIWTNDITRREFSVINSRDSLFDDNTKEKMGIIELFDSIGTGDSFVTDIENCGYQIVDMESFAIAYVCRANNKLNDFYCFKYISDNGDDSDWESALVKANEKFNEIFENSDL